MLDTRSIAGLLGLLALTSFAAAAPQRATFTTDVATVTWPLADLDPQLPSNWQDAQFLVKNEALAPERIRGVETGGCPHTAIREDASINLEAVEQLNRRFPGLDLIIVESGGDNLSATFSPELSDLTLYVIDVSAGDKLPRKGGPGICKSDLLVINKVDLAPLVGASLEVMERDTKKMRGDKPFVFSNQKTGQGLEQIIAFIERQGMLDAV